MLVGREAGVVETQRQNHAQVFKFKFNNKNLRMRRRLRNRAAYRGVSTRIVPRLIAPSNRDRDLSRARVPGSARV